MGSWRHCTSGRRVSVPGGEGVRLAAGARTRRLASLIGMACACGERQKTENYGLAAAGVWVE